MNLFPVSISPVSRKRNPFALKGLLLAGTLLALLSGSARKADAQRYDVTVIPLPTAIPFVDPVLFFAGDMNNNGDVIGTVGHNLYRAFGWTAANGPVGLPFSLPFPFSDSYGYGIDDAGDYVGQNGSGGPFIYRDSNKTQGPLPTGDVPLLNAPGFVALYYGSGQALAVSSATGFITGWANPVAPGDTTASNRPHAYAWSPSGTFIDMGGGPFNSSIARSINNNNRIAGEIQVDAYEDIHGVTHLPERGFVQYILQLGGLYGASGRVLLPTLGGENSRATKINDNDLVVGSATTPDGIFHACLWDASQADHPAINLDPSNPSRSVATGLNKFGVVVGQRSGVLGFIWDSVHGLRDLTALLPTGWTCQDAIKINDNGQILAICTFNGVSSPVLLTPQPAMSLTSVSPTTVPGATVVPILTVTGTHFTAASTIHIQQISQGNTYIDQDLPTTFDSETKLHTSIPANLLTHLADATITVTDPVRDSVGSQTLTVTPGAIPTLLSVSPNPIPVGTLIPTLTVTGTNFKPNSKIHISQITGFNGISFTSISQSLPTVYDSPNQLHASIPANLLTTFSDAIIKISDPTLGSTPGLPLTVVGVPKISIASVVATRTAGPGSPLSVVVLFANTGTADATNGSVSLASQLKLGGLNTITPTPFNIGTISNGQGMILTFPGSILPGSRVLNISMTYDGGSFSASKLVTVP